MYFLYLSVNFKFYCFVKFIIHLFFVFLYVNLIKKDFLIHKT